MHRVSFRQVSVSVLALFFLLSQTGVVAFAQSLPQMEGSDEYAIKFDVQEVKTKPEEAAVKLEKLSDERISALLSTWHAQVKSFSGVPGKIFAKPVDNKPAPPVVSTASPFEFAAPGSKKVSALSVIEALPIGESSATSTVTVHFSQQMVALSSIGQMNEKISDVSIEPAATGDWQWLDTETLQFKAASPQRLPMATNYKVTIGTGLKSLQGAALSTAYSWSFATPPIQTVSPSFSRLSEHQFVSLIFDQKVDAAKLLPYIQMQSKKKKLHFVVATEGELASFPEGLNEAHPPGAAVAIYKILEVFQSRQTVVVDIAKGCPSAEGPITSEHSFCVECEVGPIPNISSKPVKPVPFALSKGSVRAIYGETLRLPFNRTIGKCEADEVVSVLPKLTDQQIHIYGAEIQISGRPVDGARHAIHVSKALSDTEDMKLVRDLVLPITYLPCQSRLCNQSSSYQLLHPNENTTYPVYSVNVPALHVEYFKTDVLDAYAMGRELLIHQPRKNRISESYLLTQCKWNHYCKTDVPINSSVLTNSNQVILRVTACSLAEVKTGENRIRKGIIEPELEPNANMTTRVPKKSVRAVPEPPYVDTFLQLTDLGVTTYAGSDGFVYCWATNLATGLPESGVSIALHEPDAPNKATTQTFDTDSSGLAKFKVKMMSSPRPKWLVAIKGEQKSVLFNVPTLYEPKKYTAQAFTDRGLYRPGESIQFKGWLRQRGPDTTSDIEYVSQPPPRLTYKVVSARQKEIASGDLKLDSLQSFHLSVASEKDVDLGSASLSLFLPDGTAVGSTTFSIEEFRPPEFEMSLQKENSLPKYSTDAIKFTAQARYFSSGPLSRSKVDWMFRIHEASYSPPGLETFIFQGNYVGDEVGVRRQQGTRKVVGRSDIDGADVAQARITGYDDTRPLLVNAEASVTDLSSQKWSKNASCLVHPAKIYVGLKTDTNFVKAGEDSKFSIVVADVDGHKISKVDIKLELFKLPDDDSAHLSPQKPELIETKHVKSTEEPVASLFKLPTIGRYIVRASVTDDTGHKNVSTLGALAKDPKISQGVPPPVRYNSRLLRSRQVSGPLLDSTGLVSLTPNKKSYDPGETAELIAASPYKHCVGLLTIVNNGVAQITELQSTNGTLAYSIPILPSYIPSVEATLTLHSLNPQVDGKSELSKTLSMPVSSDSRRLHIKATPREKNLNPGDTNHIDFVAFKADGKPAADANVCAMVVDESILALNGYDIPDPVPFFYSGGTKYVQSLNNRSYDVLEQLRSSESDYLQDTCPTPYNQLAQLASVDRYALTKMHGYNIGAYNKRLPEDIGRAEGPRDLNLFQVEPTVIDERHYTSGRDERHQKTSPSLPEGSPMPDNDDGEPSSLPAPMAAKKPTKSRIRTEFGPLALFAPDIKTDSTGHATVSFQVPDSLTRYRVFVIAACEEKFFGKTESNFVVDQPVTLRPSTPRFANIGDQFDVPFVVTNTSDKSENVEVATCAEGALTGTSGYKFALLPNQRASVYLHAKSTATGTASVRGIALADKGFDDRIARAFPVIQSLTTEQVATYGSISRDAVNKSIQIPTPETTGAAVLDISGSASAINELRGAASYLGAYPYSCSEQLSSQILAFSAIKGMPKELADMLATRTMVQDEQATVDALCKRQQPDGGFVLWPTTDRWKEIPFVSIHASHALAAAKEAGYSVASDVLERAAIHLERLPLDKKMSKETKQSLLAYACFSEHLLGKDSVHRAIKLLEDAKLRDQPLDVLCWLAPVLKSSKPDICNAILDRLRSTVSETASTAHFTDINQDACDLFSCSDNRLNSLALETFVTLQPESPLIPKIAKALLLGRQHGHWMNTSDDAFAFGAMNKYFNLYEKEDPNFALNIWFDGKHYLDRKITERKEKVEKVNFDLSSQLASDPSLKNRSQSLIVQTEGPGRFYYRLGMQYSIKDPVQKVMDRGFKLERHYEGVSNKDDVIEQPDGSVKVKKGSTVRIVTEMVVPSHRYYVAMVDRLPAGFESINTKLFGNSIEDSTHDDIWYGGTRRINLGLSTKMVHERSLNWGNWCWGDFFQNLRDDRTEVFRDDVAPGYYRYSYLARATTSGRFIAPAASVEEMYEPETFGHSDSFYVDVVSDSDE